MRFLLAWVFVLCTFLGRASAGDSIVTYYRNGAVYEKFFAYGPIADSNYTYTRYAPLGNPIVKGQYSKGERVQLWWFYFKPSPRDTAHLQEAYNFSERKLVFLDTLKMAGLANFPGGDVELGLYVNEQFRLKGVPADSVTPWKGKKLMISFKVSKDGPPTDIKIDTRRNQVTSVYLQEVFLAILRSCPFWRRASVPTDVNLLVDLPIQF